MHIFLLTEYVRKEYIVEMGDLWKIFRGKMPRQFFGVG